MLLKLSICGVLLSACAFGNQSAHGWCEKGGATVVSSGISGVPKVQGSYPQCTVTVYLAGTLTLATIYSDNSSTPKANPFTATVLGYWNFYAANNRYDVTLSAGGIGTPFTYGDILLADPSVIATPVLSFNGRTGNVVPLSGDYSIGMITGNIVNSFNGRTGVVVPATNDYSFSQISGTLNFSSLGGTVAVPSQLSGVQGNASKVLLATGSFVAGNGIKTDASGNAIDSGAPAVPLGTNPFQWFRSGVAPYTGTFTATPFSYAADFAFNSTPSSPASLSAGGVSVTVTLAIGPPGIVVSGTYQTPVYISGGTGTAEAINLNGGTCTAAGSSTPCTIILSNVVNNHTGAWTVSSATGGWAEAAGWIESAYGGGGKIIGSPTSTVSWHAQWAIPVGHWHFDGQSVTNVTIQRAEDYPNGDLWLTTASGATELEITNLQIVNYTVAAHATGFAVNLQQTLAAITHFACHGYSCLNIDGAGLHMTNFEFQANGYAGDLITFTGANHGPSTDSYIANGLCFAGTAAGTCFNFKSADGITVTHVQGGYGNPWAKLTPGGTTANGFYIANITFDGLLIDLSATGSTVGEIAITKAPTGSTIDRIHIENSEFTGFGTFGNYGITIMDGGGTVCPGQIQILNNSFHQHPKAAILITTASTGASACLDAVMIANNEIFQIQQVLTSIGVIDITNYSVDIMNNSIVGNGVAPWGIGIADGSGNNALAHIEGNAFSGAGTWATAPLSYDKGTGFFPFQILQANNFNIDNVVSTNVSSVTADLILPLNPIFTISTTTGRTSVSTATGVTGCAWAGRQGYLRTTGGAVTFTAGATIGNTLTTTINVPVFYYCDGTRLWLK